MQIYTNFRRLQKIIVIFAPHIPSYVTKNTDHLDIFSDYRSNFAVCHRTGFFSFRAGSFYISRLCCPDISGFHKHIKLFEQKKTDFAEQDQHVYKRFVARFIGVLDTHIIWRNAIS